jgi:hypothetical protein
MRENDGGENGRAETFIARVTKAQTERTEDSSTKSNLNQDGVRFGAKNSGTKGEDLRREEIDNLSKNNQKRTVTEENEDRMDEDHTSIPKAPHPLEIFRRNNRRDTEKYLSTRERER